MTPEPVDPEAVAPAVANLDTIVSLSKRRGFIFPSSEIYGGINAVWDYGPLGVELKNNVKRAWWRAMVQDRNDIVGLDAGILIGPVGRRGRGRIGGRGHGRDLRCGRRRWQCRSGAPIVADVSGHPRVPTVI